MPTPSRRADIIVRREQYPESHPVRCMTRASDALVFYPMTVLGLEYLLVRGLRPHGGVIRAPVLDGLLTPELVVSWLRAGCGYVVVEAESDAAERHGAA